MLLCLSLVLVTAISTIVQGMKVRKIVKDLAGGKNLMLKKLNLLILTSSGSLQHTLFQIVIWTLSRTFMWTESYNSCQSANLFFRFSELVCVVILTLPLRRIAPLPGDPWLQRSPPSSKKDLRSSYLSSEEKNQSNFPPSPQVRKKFKRKKAAKKIQKMNLINK